MLGIRNGWRVYGTDSAVADFEMQCDLPKKVSRIVLDPKRPYGFFYFAPGRWRFIHRINESEDRREAITESAATELLHSKLSRARTSRFLWASAFRLGQGQSQTYRQGRWFLCGDAAHAMGPSAGAGMMVGVLGAWRLAWRLALATKGDPRGQAVLDGYEREQRAASEEVPCNAYWLARNEQVSGSSPLGSLFC
jgi:2-polyprenyl-6-methoxyphenol hydroxylase-like FAD-dependent oxidoreductase